MKHIAAIAHGTNVMILFPFATLFDLEVFFRGGLYVETFTDVAQRRYVFDDKFPNLTTETLHRNLLIEVYGIASAIQGLHEELHICGKPAYYLAHLDLKPENILITEKPGFPIGFWMLSDFGVSHFAKDKTLRPPIVRSVRDYARQLTADSCQERPKPGKGSFQPPEDSDIDAIDARKCDVWSFGCILVDLLAFAIGRVAGLEDFRSLRFDVDHKDRFYKAKDNMLLSVRDNANATSADTEVKPDITQWLSKQEVDADKLVWVSEYIRMVRQILIIEPQDRKDMKWIVASIFEGGSHYSSIKIVR